MLGCLLWLKPAHAEVVEAGGGNEQKSSIEQQPLDQSQLKGREEGVLVVHANIAGFKVSVDGKNFNSAGYLLKLPLIQSEEDVPYVVTASKAGYRDETLHVKIVPGETTSRHVTFVLLGINTAVTTFRGLDPENPDEDRRNFLVVESDPPGAEVYLDEEWMTKSESEQRSVLRSFDEEQLRLIPRTPATFTNYPVDKTGSALVVFRRGNNLRMERREITNPGGIKVGFLEGQGYLFIVTEEESVTVYCDGDLKGRTAGSAMRIALESGVHEIRLEKPGYKVFVRKVSIMPGEKTYLSNLEGIIEPLGSQPPPPVVGLEEETECTFLGYDPVLHKDSKYLVVVSDPPGAKVQLKWSGADKDSQAKVKFSEGAVTPVVFTNLKAHDWFIQVSKDGVEWENSSISVDGFRPAEQSGARKIAFEQMDRHERGIIHVYVPSLEVFGVKVVPVEKEGEGGSESYVLQEDRAIESFADGNTDRFFLPVEVDSGDYVVEVRASGRETWYSYDKDSISKEDIITVGTGEVKTVRSVELPIDTARLRAEDPSRFSGPVAGYVTIRSSQPDAEVMLEGKPLVIENSVVRTPVAISGIPQGLRWEFGLVSGCRERKKAAVGEELIFDNLPARIRIIVEEGVKVQVDGMDYEDALISTSDGIVTTVQGANNHEFRFSKKGKEVVSVSRGIGITDSVRDPSEGEESGSRLSPVYGDGIQPHSSWVVGNGSTIGEGAVLAEHIRIGRNSVISSARVGAGVTIGDNVHVGAGVAIGAGSRIGSEVEIGDGAQIHEGVQIGSGSKVRAGAKIFQAASIGRHAKIGTAEVGVSAVVEAGAEVMDGETVAAFATVTADSGVIGGSELMQSRDGTIHGVDFVRNDGTLDVGPALIVTLADTEPLIAYGSGAVPQPTQYEPADLRYVVIKSVPSGASIYLPGLNSRSIPASSKVGETPFWAALHPSQDELRVKVQFGSGLFAEQTQVLKRTRSTEYEFNLVDNWQRDTHSRYKSALLKAKADRFVLKPHRASRGDMELGWLEPLYQGTAGEINWHTPGFPEGERSKKPLYFKGEFFEPGHRLGEAAGRYTVRLHYRVAFPDANSDCLRLHYEIQVNNESPVGEKVEWRRGFEERKIPLNRTQDVFLVLPEMQGEGNKSFVQEIHESSDVRFETRLLYHTAKDDMVSLHSELPGFDSRSPESRVHAPIGGRGFLPLVLIRDKKFDFDLVIRLPYYDVYGTVRRVGGSDYLNLAANYLVNEEIKRLGSDKEGALGDSTDLGAVENAKAVLAKKIASGQVEPVSEKPVSVAMLLVRPGPSTSINFSKKEGSGFIFFFLSDESISAHTVKEKTVAQLFEGRFSFLWKKEYAYQPVVGSIFLGKKRKVESLLATPVLGQAKLAERGALIKALVAIVKKGAEVSSMERERALKVLSSFPQDEIEKFISVEGALRSGL